MSVREEGCLLKVNDGKETGGVKGQKQEMDDRNEY